LDQGAVKNKGVFHRSLHIPEGKKIPVLKLKAAIKRGGKISKQARLALILRE